MLHLLLNSVLVYLGIRLLWSLFAPSRPGAPPRGKQTSERFEARGKKVADAEYEEVQ